MNQARCRPRAYARDVTRTLTLFIAILAAAVLTMPSDADAKNARRNPQVVKTSIPAGSSSAMNTGITLPDVDYTGELGYKRIRAAGARFTRVITFWSRVAPSVNPSHWNPINPLGPTAIRRLI